jgi:outer membrane receptor for ferrienterochelin and colicin
MGEQLGLGTFITRDGLDHRNAMDVSDVLRTVPSLRLVRNGATGGYNVVIGVPGRGCRYAKVLLDGVWQNRWGDRHEEDNDIDLMASPDLLAGIEIYRGGAQMPAEFGGPTARCGVVALWTRRGR